MWLNFCIQHVLIWMVCRHRICRQAKAVLKRTTTQQSSNLTEQRNILQTHLCGWEEILPIYMPRLLQHCASFKSDIWEGPSLQPVAGTNHPENGTIWLPSKIPNNFHIQVCHLGLAAIEEKIQTVQCHDNLDPIWTMLNMKIQMVTTELVGAFQEQECMQTVWG